MRSFLITMFCAATLLACNKPKEQVAEPVAEEPKAPQDFEFGDDKYTGIGKQGMDQLSSGDVDGWMNSFADNAVYTFSAGDSLAGKKAITDYWKERRGKFIDSIQFSNHVWIPMIANQQENGPMPGNWLLSWYRVQVKYKTGKKLSFFVHSVTHFNNEDKIDRVIQYFDRAPINAALAAKR